MTIFGASSKIQSLFLERAAKSGKKVLSFGKLFIDFPLLQLFSELARARSLALECDFCRHQPLPLSDRIECWPARIIMLAARSFQHYIATKKHIYLTPYVCNEQIFDGLQFKFNKIFLNKKLLRFVAYQITLHLVPFASQSVNHSSRPGSLKAQSKPLF